MNSKKVVRYVTVSTSGGNDVMLGVNSQRETVIISTVAPAGLTIRFGQSASIEGVGLHIPGTQNPFVMTNDIWGDEITKSLNVFGAGGQQVTIVEITTERKE